MTTKNLTMREHIEKAKAAQHIIIIGEERVLESWLKDAWTFGVLAAFTYANHAYLGGSSIMFAIIGICWLVWCLAKATGNPRRLRLTQHEFTELCASIARHEV